MTLTEIREYILTSLHTTGSKPKSKIETNYGETVTGYVESYKLGQGQEYITLHLSSEAGSPPVNLENIESIADAK